MIPRKISTADIAAILNCSAKHVRERVVTRVGFPPPSVNLSPKMRRWDEPDVLRYFKDAQQSPRGARGNKRPSAS